MRILASAFALHSELMQRGGAEVAGDVDEVWNQQGGIDVESESSLIDRLRDHVVGELHRGTLRGGDRLPGVRETTRETGSNARTVAKAYRTLEAEGLVEVRGRSGVYVARQEQPEGEMLPETARWMAGVLVEAWRRMIKLPDFPSFIRRYTGSVRIRCAAVESVEDAVRAYGFELREDWGLEVDPGRSRGNGSTAAPAHEATHQILGSPNRAPARGDSCPSQVPGASSQPCLCHASEQHASPRRPPTSTRSIPRQRGGLPIVARHR
jgi:DNA-binding transcriptional regulator YhcF (GntR family)